MSQVKLEKMRQKMRSTDEDREHAAEFFHDTGHCINQPNIFSQKKETALRPPEALES